MGNDNRINPAPDAKPSGRGRPLAVEISAVLVIKLIFLWTIWSLWFAHPQAPDMTMPADKVSEHILAGGSQQDSFPTR